jgi:hypothetical protein
MISIIYHIKPEDRDAELEWLRDQKIFPSMEEAYRFNDKGEFVRQLMIGVIVSPAAALNIKLRHNLDMQKDYRQR